MERKILQQITCAICMRIYRDPISLRCVHFFCKSCADRLPITPTESGKKSVTCPVCRLNSKIPRNGFFGAFLINNLKEIYIDSRQSSHDNSCEFCTAADGKNKFCQDCCKCVCKKCAMQHKSPCSMAISPIHTSRKVQNTSAIAFSRDGFFVVVEWDDNSYSISKIFMMPVDAESSYSAYDQCPGVGMAITKDNFILLCTRRGIVKITMDGSIMTSVDREEVGYYDDKSNLSLSPVTGLIYVVDRCKHNIEVLNPDLTFNCTFGSEGSSVGQFRYPSSIALDDQGNVYVLDEGKTGNSRVQKFTGEGKFLSTFDVQQATGIALAKNFIFVSAYDSVLVYSTDGKFLCQGDYPGSITVAGITVKCNEQTGLIGIHDAVFREIKLFSFSFDMICDD